MGGRIVLAGRCYNEVMATVDAATSGRPWWGADGTAPGWLQTAWGTMKNAALYHRVSTVDQNVRLARRELRAAAKARGYHVVLDVEETGSGASNDRPGLQRVMEAARRGKVRAVFVWKLDRWGRSALDLLKNVTVLRDAGVRFVATTQGIDVGAGGADAAVGNLVLAVLAGVAEFERAVIVERTRLGMANARAAGKRIGRPPRAVDELALNRLRREGRSWRAIATRMGVSRRVLQRAAGKVAQKGGGRRPVGERVKKRGGA